MTIALERRGPLQRNVATVVMVTTRELLRFRRSPTRVVTGLAQPLLFLFVMGGGIAPLIGGRDTGGIDFQEFLFPGVIAMSVLFSSMFSAISIVWDREFGFLREMLVAPVSRASIVVGKAVGGGSVAVGQGLVLVVCAPLVGVSLTVPRVLEMVGLLLAMAFALVAFGITVASRLQRIESFQVVMTLVVNPMLFLSGAIFPVGGLGGWLGAATRLNPATYAVDPIRRVLLGDSTAMTWGDWVVPIWLEVLIVIAFGVGLLGMAVRSMRTTD